MEVAKSIFKPGEILDLGRDASFAFELVDNQVESFKKGKALFEKYKKDLRTTRGRFIAQDILNIFFKRIAHSPYKQDAKDLLEQAYRIKQLSPPDTR